MTVSAADRRSVIRLVSAIVISPSVPITVLSVAYWKATGSTGWFAIVFLFGYLFYLLLGIPIAAFLVRKGRLLNCILAGGVATITPLLLLSALSLSVSQLTVKTLVSIILLFVAGCLGGLLFWLIAFAKRSNVNPRA